jgi:hypothetical protein
MKTVHQVRLRTAPTHGMANSRRENPRKLMITGRRLDAVAPKLASDDHANAGGMGDHAFIISGVDIPTLGCWQITGDYNGDKLTFVIWVAP